MAYDVPIGDRGAYMSLVSDPYTWCVLSAQAEPLRVVQPPPVSPGAQGPAGEPVHPWEQLVVPHRRLHAAGLRDHAEGPVYPMCQRGVVSRSCCCC